GVPFILFSPVHYLFVIAVFSMILESAVGWGVGQILDVITGCSECGQKDDQTIGNIQENNISCSNCHCKVTQFTNACDFTFNSKTYEIGQAHIWTPESDWTWEKSNKNPLNFVDKIFGSKNSRGVHSSQQFLNIERSVRVRGLRGRSIVCCAELKDYESGNIIASHNSIINPSYEDVTFNNKWINFTPESINSIKGGQIIAVDYFLRSEYKDVIAQQRKLIQPRF
ncbi:MAG: hypothetical protein ACTS2F_13155, partial [Thainema sp.]